MMAVVSSPPEYAKTTFPSYFMPPMWNLFELALTIQQLYLDCKQKNAYNIEKHCIKYRTKCIKIKNKGNACIKIHKCYNVPMQKKNKRPHRGHFIRKGAGHDYNTCHGIRRF